MDRRCEICGKMIEHGYMTDDLCSFTVHEGKCFNKFMNKEYGKHRWMMLGKDREDEYGGYYLHASDITENGYMATGIYYTEDEE